MLHHSAADALALTRRINHHRLDHARRRAEMGDVVHDKESEGADDDAVILGDEKAIVRIRSELPQDRLSFRHGQHRLVEPRLPVERKHRREVGVGRYPNERAHAASPARCSSQWSVSEQTNIRPPRSSRITSSR